MCILSLHTFACAHKLPILPKHYERCTILLKITRKHCTGLALTTLYTHDRKMCGACHSRILKSIRRQEASTRDQVLHAMAATRAMSPSRDLSPGVIAHRQRIAEEFQRMRAYRHLDRAPRADGRPSSSATVLPKKAQQPSVPEPSPPVRPQTSRAAPQTAPAAREKTGQSRKSTRRTSSFRDPVEFATDIGRPTSAYHPTGQMAPAHRRR